MADHCRNFDLFFCYIDVFFWTRHSNNSGQVFCSEAEWDLEEKGKGGDCQVRTYQPTNASYFNVSRKPGRYRLGLRFLRRFWRCLRILNPHCLSPTFLLFVTLLGLSLADQMFVYSVGLIPSKFYEVLGEKNEQGFKSLLPTVLLQICGSVLVKSLCGFVSSVLRPMWRGLITRHLHHGYFAKTAYYELSTLQKNSTDNPDQRLTDEVDKFCNQMRKKVSILAISPVMIAYYTYKCHESSGFLGPVCIYGSFLLSVLVNKFVMAPVISSMVNLDRCEGDFRLALLQLYRGELGLLFPIFPFKFKHMHVRVNAEQIAFSRSGKLEERKTDDRLQAVLDGLVRYAKCDFFLYVSVQFFDVAGSPLSFIIIAISLFNGTYDGLSAAELSSKISKNHFFYMYLITSFTRLNDWSSSLAETAGYAHRIGELAEHIDSLNQERDSSDNNQASSSSGTIAPPPSEGPAFKLSRVTYGAPNSLIPLVEDLDLEVKLGENLLITGASGCGKTSLLRILGGLWQPTSGVVTRNIPTRVQSVCFLPQKPFLTDGTLRQQIVYPLNEFEYETSGTPGEDDQITKLLETVGLTNLLDCVGGINKELVWNCQDRLSPGELQQLAFARLFYHKPLLAVLDEATSALDPATETAMYNLCRRFGITLVSVGDRKTLTQFHANNLILDGTGGWSVAPLKAQ